MDIKVSSVSLNYLAAVNIILGKNGVGKSNLLREIDKQYQGDPAFFLKYISPERGGELSFNASVEQNIRSPNWALDARRRNRVDNFRHMSFSEYKNLETLILRERERNASAPSFDDTINKINALLQNVRIHRGSKADPELRRISDDSLQKAETLSSGESELLSIAIEVLSFCAQAKHADNSSKIKLLLLDEPDVHLHPDLQHRLMGLVESSALEAGAVVVIATHSTALLGALNDSQARVAFMTKEAKALAFSPISEQLRDILPIFGAHPLTNIFGERPILIVEGEDDVRIWQQAARSSHGRIRIWPSAAGDIQSLERYENVAADIIGAVYDDAVAYSLRDRDDAPYEIDDKPHVIRMRLYCRSAENLILSDDVLALLGTDWLDFQARIRDCIGKNGDHSQFASVSGFAESFDRVMAAVKDLRNLFMVIAGSNKPWEVAVGQSIARLDSRSSQAEGSLLSMLGPKAVNFLRLR